MTLERAVFPRLRSSSERSVARSVTAHLDECHLWERKKGGGAGAPTTPFPKVRQRANESFLTFRVVNEGPVYIKLDLVFILVLR